MNEQALSLVQALGFTRQPFDKDLPAKLLFMSQQIKQLFELLQRFLHRRGIALVTGEIGSGKSTTIRAFIERLDKTSYEVAYIADPTIGIRGILNSMAIQLNLQGGYFKWQLLEKLKAAIEKNAYDFKKTTLLLIDEAQLLSPKTLEELRLFTNFKFDSQTPLNLILSGQPDLKRTILLNPLQALFQRITFHYHLTGLQRTETKDYITHHLAVAGRTDPMFADDVINEIFQHAKGIPRIINKLSYDCLVSIVEDNKNIVDQSTLERVLLTWDMN